MDSDSKVRGRKVYSTVLTRVAGDSYQLKNACLLCAYPKLLSSRTIPSKAFVSLCLQDSLQAVVIIQIDPTWTFH